MWYTVYSVLRAMVDAYFDDESEYWGLISMMNQNTSADTAERFVSLEIMERDLEVAHNNLEAAHNDLEVANNNLEAAEDKIKKLKNKIKELEAKVEVLDEELHSNSTTTTC